MLGHTQTRPVSAHCHLSLSPDLTPCKCLAGPGGLEAGEPCLVFMYNEKGDESVNKLLLFYAPSKRNIVCNAKLRALFWAEQVEQNMNSSE